jgi:hypothetical protein
MRGDTWWRKTPLPPAPPTFAIGATHTPFSPFPRAQASIGRPGPRFLALPFPRAQASVGRPGPRFLAPGFWPSSRASVRRTPRPPVSGPPGFWPPRPPVSGLLVASDRFLPPPVSASTTNDCELGSLIKSGGEGYKFAKSCHSQHNGAAEKREVAL